MLVQRCIFFARWGFVGWDYGTLQRYVIPPLPHDHTSGSADLVSQARNQWRPGFTVAYTARCTSCVCNCVVGSCAVFFGGVATRNCSHCGTRIQVLPWVHMPFNSATLIGDEEKFSLYGLAIDVAFYVRCVPFSSQRYHFVCCTFNPSFRMFVYCRYGVLLWDRISFSHYVMSITHLTRHWSHSWHRRPRTPCVCGTYDAERSAWNYMIPVASVDSMFSWSQPCWTLSSPTLHDFQTTYAFRGFPGWKNTLPRRVHITPCLFLLFLLFSPFSLFLFMLHLFGSTTSSYLCTLKLLTLLCTSIIIFHFRNLSL